MRERLDECLKEVYKHEEPKTSQQDTVANTKTVSRTSLWVKLGDLEVASKNLLELRKRRKDYKEKYKIEVAYQKEEISNLEKHSSRMRGKLETSWNYLIDQAKELQNSQEVEAYKELLIVGAELIEAVLDPPFNIINHFFYKSAKDKLRGKRTELNQQKNTNNSTVSNPEEGDGKAVNCAQQ